MAGVVESVHADRAESIQGTSQQLELPYGTTWRILLVYSGAGNEKVNCIIFFDELEIAALGEINMVKELLITQKKKKKKRFLDKLHTYKS